MSWVEDGPTMTPEEEAEWLEGMRNGVIHETATPPKRKEKPIISTDTRHLFCAIAGCLEEATGTGRCVRHEAVWVRLHAELS